MAVAVPDLELRRAGGAGAVLTYVPCWLFSLLSFLPFFTQNKARGGPLGQVDNLHGFESSCWGF